MHLNALQGLKLEKTFTWQNNHNPLMLRIDAIAAPPEFRSIYMILKATIMHNTEGIDNE